MKLFYSIVTSFISIIGYSQTILHQPESTTRTVQDPQTVVMAPGFRATSEVSNPFIAKIGPATENPGGGPADSGAGAANPSGTTTPQGVSFHDTKGNIEVNGAGQLQFTLPIALPPGVKSVAPQINLVYTSGSGNGIAGYGWNLSGITAISRIGKNIDKDGETKGIQLDYSDHYSFNGQRLILKSGEYGKDGAEYVTEKYSNIKIKSVGSFPVNGQLAGPAHFEVTFEDGSQAWYGGYVVGSRHDPEVTTPLEYNIVKWRDTQGNYISYGYQSTANSGGFRIPGIVRISSISWGGNETLSKPHFNTIEFVYIDRDLKEQSYVQGLGFIQDKLLSNIVVKTNGTQFKKYTIDYVKNGTNYQFVDKITEYNSQNQAANPVIFTYPTPTQQSLEYSVAPNNGDNFDNVKLTGDFNGDSYLDFVMYNGVVKLGVFNDTFTTISTNKVFSNGAKVVSTLLDEEGQIYNGSGIVQYEEGKIVGYIFRNNTFVKVFEKDVYNIHCSINTSSHTCIIQAKLNEGDLDGDGISSIILSLNREECYTNTVDDPTQEQGPEGCYNTHAGDYIVDLKNSNIPIATYTVDVGINENSYTNQKYMDVDGDRKVDIINVSNTNYTVFEFVKTAPNQYLKKIKFTGNLTETKDSKFPVLFGDFNGDGNLDFTIPITDSKNADNWRFYMGRENGFQNVLKTDFLKYRKPAQESPLSLIDHHFYSISDINKDGKSDIVFIYSKNEVRGVGTSGNALWRSLQYEVKSMQANGGTDFIEGFSTISNSYSVGGAEKGIFQPLTNTIKSNNNYYDIFIFKDTRVHKYKAQTSLAELSSIKSIRQGGVLTTISYKELTPDINLTFYKKVKKEYYPYFSLIRADQSYAVSQLQQASRKQDFRYRGMTGHLQGKGMIGFQQTARSSWYADGFENTKIWSGVEIDPLNDALPVKEWSIRTTDESKIFPDNLSINNILLISFKEYKYNLDKLLNGNIVTNVPDSDKSKVVLAINPHITTSKDFLTNTKTVHTVEQYDNLYLPKKSITNINDGYAISTSELEYYPPNFNPGANYSIGKPKVKKETVQAYGDIKSTKEEYTYENSGIKTLKSWNRDNTGYILETYNYDGFGNITQKTITNSIDSQIQTSKTEYDSKGRFVVKKTDNLELETNISYNDWGQILNQTDPLGNILTNTYDNWGKILTSKTNLGGTTTYQYERDNNSNIIVTQYDSDGNVSKKYTNILGQNYKASTKAFGQGQFVFQETQYDVLGRKLKESEPYFEGQSASQWNIITYDDSVFPAKVTATSFNGKQMETMVSGLTTTVKELNGYGRTNSKTADALGNVVSSTDKGGTIAFSYNAAGEQIKAQYVENIVSTKYDSWGRKSEFNDPSNGLYKYEYDGFGQPKKIISPKGKKEYIYNNLGQLITQKEHSTADGGQATDKTIIYSYDNKGRVISKAGTSKGKTYSSNILYDQQGRVLSSSESSNGKYFIQKGITYDDKARVISYEKQLFSSGILTKVNVENIYSAWNGELYQVKDKNSGKILWELKESNAKGQVLKAKLGAADVNNIYDVNGFLTNVNHSSTIKPSILQISYSFNAIKNELNSRTTGGDFNILETFDYDDNNRLINWTNPVTGIKPSSNRNVYDVKGRIIQNDQVGTIKFENSAKIYQPTGMTLNAGGTQNYNNDLIQSIVYNENNDPVFLDGEKGDVAFQYGLTSMRQRVTYGGNFSTNEEGKFTKFYSEDGSFEVVKDNTTGKEKHILYIGGNPYESNIVYLKNFDESNGSYKFLHKDYIGSVLAISDEAGNKLEQRHFDAWGNFTHLKIGNGAVITDKNAILSLSKDLIISRGYTSHEHFAEVGIIHMNGRLYDPLLRRFLNADENIQDPYNTQNYNKYGYVFNNPLMFNDPSGEYLFGLVESAIVAALIIGATVGVVSYTAITLIAGEKLTFFGFYSSLIMGAVTGAVTAGIGEVFSAATHTLGNTLFQGLAHSTFQGVLSAMQGGNFWSAAGAGLLGSLGASAFGAVAKEAARSAVGQIAFGAVAGGVGSELAGGNFWQGALIGGIVAGLNHALHSGDMEPATDNDDEYMLVNGKIVKVGTKGGNTTDYLYDETYGPNTNPTLLATADVQNGFATASEGGGTRTFGVNIQLDNRLPSPALYDPSFDIMSSYVGGGIVGKSIGALSRGTFMFERFAYRAGGQSTFALKWMNQGKTFMFRLERQNSYIAPGVSRAYTTHINWHSLKTGANRHIYLNPKYWKYSR